MNNKQHEQRGTYLIPQRHVVSGLVFLAGVTYYLLRYNLSNAIISMAKFNKTSASLSGDVCISYDDTEVHDGQFEWDETTQGVILGSFFYGYIMFQVVGGRLSELFGAKWLCGFGVGMAIIINALTPLIIHTNIYWLLLASRVALGAFSALVHPSFYALFSKWSPDHERSTVLSLPQIGGNLGAIAASGLSGYLADHGFAGGWPSIFYVSALISCVWFILWVIYVRSEPKAHPWISLEEMQYIECNIASNSSKSKKSVPWLQILTSMPVLSTIIIKFTIMWNYLLFMLKLPAYLQTVFHMSGNENGLITSLVYLVLTISLFVSGIIADKIIQKKLISKSRLRKLFDLSASFGSSICLVIIPTAGCNERLVITLLFIGSVLLGMMAGGNIPVIAGKCSHFLTLFTIFSMIDMTNNFSATVFAMANTAVCLGGILIPLVSGMIVDGGDQPRKQWGYVFYLSAALNLIGGILYIIFGSAERQKWDKEDYAQNYIERI